MNFNLHYKDNLKIKILKSLPFDKKHIIVDKETFESMNKVIEESKKIKEIEPKIKTIFKEVDSFASNYKTLEKENKNYEKEINRLEEKNNTLERDNRSLIYQLTQLFDFIKKFLRRLLLRGNEYTKDLATKEVKDYYDNDDFEMMDVVHISKGTTKQDELFDYVDAPDYLKERPSNNKDRDDFCL